MSTPLIDSTGELTEFDVVDEAHSHCEACWREAVSAAITARVTGSRGATHSTNSPDGEHKATVKRVRCYASNSRVNGGDCCCSICMLPPGAYYVNPDAPEEGWDYEDASHILARAFDAVIAEDSVDTRSTERHVASLLNALTEAGYEIRRMTD